MCRRSVFLKNESKANTHDEHVNKHEQSNHNGRRANRRTVTQPAKTPVIPMLTISNVLCGFYAPLRAENMLQTPKPEARDDDRRKAQK